MNSALLRSQPSKARSPGFSPSASLFSQNSRSPLSAVLQPSSWGLLFVLFSYALAVFLSWRKWPDLLVDFGTQLYLPWQMSSGAVLYRDIMYLTGGPLSQHYHALLFSLFGPSLLTIIISNLLIALGLLVLLYRLFLVSSDVWTATTICVGIALVFACNQYSNVGNFNFITPYCHEVWHGLVLSIVAISLLARSAQRRVRLSSPSSSSSSSSSSSLLAWKPPFECVSSTFAPELSSAGAGVCLGLVFMTKPEVFAALLLAVAAALLLVAANRGLRAAAKGAAWLLAAALLPLAAFLLWFHRVENWHDSFRSVAFAWVPLLNSSVSQQFFYRWCLGLDAPRFHLRMMFNHLLVLSAVICGLALMLRQKLNTTAKRLSAFGALSLLLALATGFDWVDCGRSLPVLSLLTCLTVGTVLTRILRVERRQALPPPLGHRVGDRSTPIFDPPNEPRPRSRRRPRPRFLVFPEAKTSGEEDRDKPLHDNQSRFQMAVFPFLWSVFALALLAKLGLYSRIWHYGFVLAMPAFVAAIFLLLWLLPLWLHRFNVDRRLFRLAITALLAVGFLRLFVQSQQSYSAKTVPIGHGNDIVFAPSAEAGPTTAAVRTALDWLDKNASPNASLAVLPEGVMLNYLSRRVNPTRYLVWNPAEISSFGQQTMTDAFRTHPPDYVMLVHRDASEYGAAFFGQRQDFGSDLLQWINSNYQPVCLIGHEPLRNSLFGIKILKKVTRADDSSAR